MNPIQIRRLQSTDSKASLGRYVYKTLYLDSDAERVPKSTQDLSLELALRKHEVPSNNIRFAPNSNVEDFWSMGRENMNHSRVVKLFNHVDFREPLNLARGLAYNRQIPDLEYLIL